MSWHSIVERRIAQAQDQGAFDNLEGRGRPLRLKPNPFADKDWQLAYDLLENAGLAPRWIELDRDIRYELRTARTCITSKLSSNVSRHGRDLALKTFIRSIHEINQMIRELNLIVPSARFSRPQIRIEQELSKLD
jgi:DnaJ family protein C protein 28